MEIQEYLSNLDSHIFSMNQSSLCASCNASSTPTTTANKIPPASDMFAWIVIPCEIMAHSDLSWDPGEDSQNQSKEQQELLHINDHMQ